MFAPVSLPATTDCAAYEAGQSAELRLGYARAARLRGDYAEAECTLEQLLLEQPRNADAWVEFGLVRAAAGDAAGARDAFLQALDIAPDYADAELGLARLAYRAGDVAGARMRLQRIGDDRRDDVDVVELRQALSLVHPEEAASRWDAFTAYSALSNGLAPWREASIAASRRDGAVTLGASLEYVERFERTDLYLEGRFSRSLDWGALGVALGGAQDPHFRPEAALRIEFEGREDRDWLFDGSLTIARYTVGEIDRFALRTGRNISPDLQISAQGIVVQDEADEVRIGYSVGAALQTRETLKLELNWSDAPESSEGVTLDVRTFSFGAITQLGSGFRVRWGILREERDAFDRVEFSLGLARRF